MAAPGMRDLSIKHPRPEYDRNENSPLAKAFTLGYRAAAAAAHHPADRRNTPCQPRKFVTDDLAGCSARPVDDSGPS